MRERGVDVACFCFLARSACGRRRAAPLRSEIFSSLSVREAETRPTRLRTLLGEKEEKMIPVQVGATYLSSDERIVPPFMFKSCTCISILKSCSLTINLIIFYFYVVNLIWLDL
jgi:hypothetical protein